MSVKFICDSSISTDGLNLKIPNLSNGHLLFTNKGIITGKKYWEIKLLTGSKVSSHTTIFIGVAIASAVNVNSNFKGIYGDRGVTYPGNVPYAGYSGVNINDVIGVAFDADNGKIKFSVNGIWFGDLNTGLTIGVEIFPVITDCYNINCIVNFGASEFSYSIPDGYMGLDSNKYMIKQNNSYYTLNDYDESQDIYKPTLLTNPLVDDFNNYGISSLSLIHNEALMKLIIDKYNLSMLK